MNAGLYKHYKGGIYQVLGIGQHTETGEKMVVYVSLDARQSGPRLRVRPLDGPEGFRTIARVNGKAVERFYYIGDGD